MVTVVEKAKPAPELWEQILLVRELEPFYEWLEIPELAQAGIALPAFLVFALFFAIKMMRKKINKNSEVGFHDGGY